MMTMKPTVTLMRSVVRRLARSALPLAVAVAALVSTVTRDAIADTADLVFENGTIFTVDAQDSVAQALAIKNGKIVYVGNNSGAASWKDGTTRTVDLKGKMVLPGFVDSHSHVYLRTEAMFWVNLNGARSLQQYKERTQDFLRQHPGAKQVRGVGFDLGLVLKTVADSGVPASRLLDEIVGQDIPAVFLTNGHHQIWVNSRAMKNAAITEDTRDPEGASIDRDANGKPIGIFREFAAQNLIIQKLPFSDFTIDEFTQAVLSFQTEVAAPRGITSVRVPVHYPTEAYLRALKQLDAEKKLTLRQDLVLWADETRGVSQVPELVDRHNKYFGTYFKIAGVKFFGTGVGQKSNLVWKQDVLNRTIAAVDKEGLQIFIHVVGPTSDYAAMLDALEYAIKQNGKRDSRHAITHTHTPATPLVARFAALGVWADGHPPPKAFFDAGIKVTSSSDYPAFEHTPSPALAARIGFSLAARPLAQIETGVQRGVPIAQMIRSHTLTGAELIFSEKETGSLEVGKTADIVVLERDITKVPVEDIHTTKILTTLFAGKMVYRDAGFEEAAQIPLERPRAD